MELRAKTIVIFSTSSSFMHFVGQLPIRLFCLFYDERETKYEDKVEQNREFWAQKSLEFGFTRNLLRRGQSSHAITNM